MYHPEQVKAYEPASEPALRWLYVSASVWLREHGIYFVEPSAKVAGTHNGLPIVDHSPRFEYNLDEDSVRALSPQAIDVLGLVGELEIYYVPPSYSYVYPDGDMNAEPIPTYAEPGVSFSIPQHQSSPIKSKHLGILINEQGKAGSSIMTEEEEVLKPDPSLSVEEIERNALEAWELEEATGADQITVEQCQVLQEIVDGLASASHQA